MKFILIFSLVIFLPCFFSCNSSVKKSIELSDSTAVNEFDVLMEFIEKSGDYFNSEDVPSLILAGEVNKSKENYLILDIRDKETYESGHIEGAVNIQPAEIINYLEDSVIIPMYEKIVIVDCNGQKASFVAGIIRLIGYANAYAMKWGMSSWHRDFADDYWLQNINDKYAEYQTSEIYSMDLPSDYPFINTGKITGLGIVKEQADKLLTTDFESSFITIDKLMQNIDDYYIICYLPEDYYNSTHLKKSVLYVPKQYLKKESYLSTLPIDQKIVIYCYSGHHSAYITAYLRILGYNAINLDYGMNSFMFSKMKSDEFTGKSFDPDNLIFDFEYIKGKFTMEKEEINPDTLVAKKDTITG